MGPPESLISALTIAGSDSSGRAGIQADLGAFAAFGVRGLSAVTALTVQDSAGVQAVFDVPADFVTRQIVSARREKPAAVKTGMLANDQVVEAVARALGNAGGAKLVVDPVMTSTSGYRLLDKPGVTALVRRLLPICLVLTPNLDEAEELSGLTVRTTDQMREAARVIHGKGAPYVLVKGGHLEGDSTDVFFDGSSFEEIRGRRVEGADTHGTGCVLSAAITARLALGDSVLDAIVAAKQFVTETLVKRSGVSGSAWT